ncbi:cytidine deaminase [uncultured Selenomonas sp.]|uniref:cytidine deaminase n=1 Tax=uncultured Selenomonas sp. TaxID=159275 RepID=UPI0028DB14B5|nr:cytidine deaminase [uncultured Selenomonas sp.]
MDDKALVELAKKARANAYAPYSGFSVGAAVLAADGRVFSGCNIENASYGLTNCAERTAIFSAVAAGARELAALAVVADGELPCSPCGACRQVIAEFAVERIILANLAGKSRVVTKEDLLPFAFSFEEKSLPSD